MASNAARTGSRSSTCAELAASAPYVALVIGARSVSRTTLVVLGSRKPRAGDAGPAAVMSFDPAQIVPLRTSAPRFTRGLVAEGWSGDFDGSHVFARAKRAFAYGQDALRAHPQFIAYSVKDLPAALPLAARHLCGMPLLTWTVRSVEERQRAARWADQMIFEGFRP